MREIGILKLLSTNQRYCDICSIERHGNESSSGYHLFHISQAKGIIGVEIVRLSKGTSFKRVSLANGISLNMLTAELYPKLRPYF